MHLARNDMWDLQLEARHSDWPMGPIAWNSHNSDGRLNFEARPHAPRGPRESEDGSLAKYGARGDQGIKASVTLGLLDPCRCDDLRIDMDGDWIPM